MENEITKFNVEDAIKSIKDKIKDAFVTLIPDEQWNDMVKKEINAYFLETDDDYYHRKKTSSFTADVHKILQEEVNERVKKYLSDNFNTVWDNNGRPVCDLKVEEFITKNAGKILADMIGAQFQAALCSAGYNINR